MRKMEITIIVTDSDGQDYKKTHTVYASDIISTAIEIEGSINDLAEQIKKDMFFDYKNRR